MLCFKRLVDTCIQVKNAFILNVIKHMKISIIDLLDYLIRISFFSTLRKFLLKKWQSSYCFVASTFAMYSFSVGNPVKRLNNKPLLK